jgi:hypothetical protein
LFANSSTKCLPEKAKLRRKPCEINQAEKLTAPFAVSTITFESKKNRSMPLSRIKKILKKKLASKAF